MGRQALTSRLGPRAQSEGVEAVRVSGVGMPTFRQENCKMCLSNPNGKRWVQGLRGSRQRREGSLLGAGRPGFYI